MTVTNGLRGVVANCGNDTVVKIRPDLTWVTLASGSQFNCPTGSL